VNTRLVDDIASAVLYEGYILYPYRPSALKNRQRFNFGVLSPQADGDGRASGNTSFAQTECLVRTVVHAELSVRVRFLHLFARCSGRLDTGSGTYADTWQEAVERDVRLSVGVDDMGEDRALEPFAWPAAREQTPPDETRGSVLRVQAALSGELQVSSKRVAADLFKLTVRVANTTPRSTSSDGGRDAWLMRSLVSTHAILQIGSGAFLSALDPPADARALAASCRQVGLWPVLVGEPPERDAMLASPIILYDYPQIAPESAGDFCDGTEIDEMLALRILTMTEAEKREMRHGDERARRMLERTESLSDDEMMRLHGVLRGLRPPAGDGRR
jgi:hypothetical protein